MAIQNIHNQAALLVLISGLALVAQSVIAQSSSDSSGIPRMPDGHPDLQGTWDFRTITPMQRPAAFGEKTVLSLEEAEIFEAEENVRRDRDNFTDTTTTGDYNQFWYDRGTELLDDRRTSLITSPADGRIPPITEAARALQREIGEVRQLAIGVEARPLSERCIMGFNSGPPMTPSAYNNNVQLVQTPDHFLIHNEMVHNVRVVKMNTTEHREIPRKWEGDSIGHWEGDTLVIETDYFARATAFRNSSANMHLVERFSMIDADTIAYEFTIEDPTTWTAPWTAMFPLRRADLPMYEYACHEGNYSMAGVLGGWRRLEQIAAQEAAAAN
ncbi:MAG: hypothetical protein IIC60_04540 [Proteobacteria bacterium]|nr:hypothetical protein [Pseudomonadota bacterium]